MIIGIELDDIVFDRIGAVRKYVAAKSGMLPWGGDEALSSENPEEWNWGRTPFSGFQEALAAAEPTHMFYAGMKPVEGAVEALRTLRAAGVKFYILTTRDPRWEHASRMALQTARIRVSAYASDHRKYRYSKQAGGLVDAFIEREPGAVKALYEKKARVIALDSQAPNAYVKTADWSRVPGIIKKVPEIAPVVEGSWLDSIVSSK